MASPLASTTIEETVSPEGREQTGQRIALLSIFIGIALSVAKVIIGWKAHSSAVISDGVEAGGDVLSSGIVYAGLWLASRPPDAEHPYGHGRYETLAGLGVGALLLVTGAGIFWHAASTSSQVMNVATLALYPLFAAVVLKGGLAFLKFRVSRRIDSGALQADAWHDLTDLLSTFVALGAVLLTIVNPVRFYLADRVGAVLIGTIIMFLSVQVVRRTVTSLLDTMPEPSRMREIRMVALGVPGALGVEKCYARRTGLRYHVDLHLEVDPELTVRESHEIATAVRGAIKDQLEWVADVLVHVEPWGLDLVSHSYPMPRR